MGLVKVKSALKKLGLEFSYEENNGLSEVIFRDDKGGKHCVEEKYYYNSAKLYLDDEEMMNQKEICNWIEQNELLLTDYEKLKSNIEKLKQERKKKEFDEEIIDTLKFEKEGYILEILTNRIGNIYYYFNGTNKKGNYEPNLMLVGDSYIWKEPLAVNIRAVGTHDMTVDETLEYIEGLKKAIETVEYFNEILKPYDENRKQLN